MASGPGGLCQSSEVHPSERVTQEVELAFRHLADARLVLVHRQLAHDRAQVLGRRFRITPPAQNHEVVGIGDEPSA